MTNPIRWGILGTGSIARSFATGLAADPGSRLVAVGSRTAATAAAFAAKFPCTAHGSYAELCADPAVDVVYIASPHPGHHAHALLAIAAGKAVLVEKPFTLNARQSAEVIAAAQAAGVFCLEAMWMRFLPAVRQAAAWLAAGAIGEVRMVTADFGFRGPEDPRSRLLDPALGGGALLDVGIYPLSFACLALGSAPTSIQATARLGATGVDEQTAITLGWDSGALASLTCAVRTATRQDAVIYGTRGRIEVPDFWHATEAILRVTGEPEIRVPAPHLGNGYTHEAIEVGRCLRAGLRESPVLPWAETLAIMRILDACRAQFGLVYPGE
jgi:predicted dehydrogenase